MSGKGIRDAMRSVYRTLFDPLLAEREKAALRRKVTSLPLGPDYPFEVETKLLRSIGIEPAMLDVGANTGIYSAVLEDLVGPENLYLFEPLPHLQQYLRRHFSKARVFGFALSDREGTQNIRVPYIDGKRFDTRASFNAHAEPNQTGFDEIAVQFFPLDSIAAAGQFGRIGFIKIDVEGHEMAVLDGAARTIGRYKPLLLVEIEARHHSFPITEIFSKLQDIGYKGYYVNPELFELLDISRFDVRRDQNQEDLIARNFFRYLNNFFFVHDTAETEFVGKAVAFLESEKRRHVLQLPPRNPS